MLYLTLEDQLFIGQEKQVGSPSTKHDYLSVVFEDDGKPVIFTRWTHANKRCRLLMLCMFITSVR